MIQPILWLILSLGIILLGAELFTNGIEWFGRRLQLAEGAIGSVLAAVGTAMPETMIPIIALVFSKEAQSDQIGIGAILGAPLMLSTVAFFVTGVAVFGFSAARRRTPRLSVDPAILGRDLRSFFLVYAVAIGAAFLPGRPYKILVAVFLVAAYVYYVRQTFRYATGPGREHELGPLHFHREAEVPRLRIIVSQVFASLVLIVGGAHLFVKHLSHIALASGVSAFVLATIIAPIATELPEKFNSVTWIRQRKDTLALGNISGAMVFQSSILPAIGLVFTQWVLDTQALATAIAALAASIFAWAELTWRKRLSPYTLLAGILFYAAYIIYTFSRNPHG
ncbi:MAG TPA: sodium:calcium antiporter [Armatimonadota bacterium]|nr:sodium:calcium antiporter [Armatimonadota bacterium]